MKRIFALLLALLMVMALLPFANAESTATVIGGWLRLRATPSLNATILNSYYTGTVVTLLDGPNNNWYHVKAPDNLVGYMVADFLSIGGTPSTNAFVVNPNGKNVNLRTGPGTGYSVIRDFAVGTPVTVLSYGSVWSRVSIHGYNGYMMTRYIGSTSPSPVPTPVCYATIWSANGGAVNLRKGPGKNNASIGQYPVGTRVAVLQKGAVWDYISVGSRTGWMMNEFLIYNGEKQVTSVSLNNYYPCVGDELYALSIAPAGATVTYQWYVGGVLSGTNSTYVVKDYDEGKSIYLKVTGTGIYIGTVNSSSTYPVSGQYRLQKVELDNNTPVVGDVLTAVYTPAAAVVSYEWYSGSTLVSTSSSYQVRNEDVGNRIYVRLNGQAPYQGTVYSQKSSVVTANKSLLTLSLDNATSVIRGIYAPAVGDTIRALYAPTSATVSCEWLRDGASISGETDTKYILKEEDLGHRITAVVTGTGSYYGRLSATTGKVVQKPVLPEITTDALLSGVVYVPYFCQLQSNVKNVSWRIADGYTLPAGLTFEDGKISGMPTKVGSTTVKFVVSNLNGETSKELVLNINQEMISLLKVHWDSITDASVSYAADEAGIINQLPSTVAIETSSGKTTAKLNWMLNGFDASKITGYTLSATAKMTVPDGVMNVFFLPVEKTVNVQVGAMPVIPLEVSIGSDGGSSIPTGTPVTLTANVIGGVPPYHYQWEVSANDQSSIVYNMPSSSASVHLTVTDSLSNTANATIGLNHMKPMEAEIVATPATTILPGEEVILEVLATEGSGSYTYLWGNEETESFRVVHPVVDTMYSVTVSDGYTSIDLEYTVIVEAPLTMETLPKEETTVEGTYLEEQPEEDAEEGIEEVIPEENAEEPIVED